MSLVEAKEDVSQFRTKGRAHGDTIDLSVVRSVKEYERFLSCNFEKTTELRFIKSRHFRVADIKSSLQQISIVSSSGMFVNKESTSNEDIHTLQSLDRISSANANVSFTVNSSLVSGSIILTRNLASLYVGVLIADRIGRNFGNPLTSCL